MKNTNLKFMSLSDEYSTDKSKYKVVLFPFEGKVTFMKGSDKGPYEILKASENLEYYEDRYDCEPFLKGIEVFENKKLKKIKDEKKSFIEIKKFIQDNKLNQELFKIDKKSIKNKKFENNLERFNIFLGGDHSVSYPIIDSYNDVKKINFDVVVFDAHSDLRDSWNDSSYNHACVSKNIIKKHNMLIAGVRSQDIDEVKFVNKNIDRISVIKSYEFELKKFKNKLNKLKENVYISIDLDVFNPELIKNTGTPEPGGLSWEDIIKSLEICFKNKNIIGLDIVEFSPRNDYEMEAYVISKLIYKVMAMKLKFN